MSLVMARDADANRRRARTPAKQQQAAGVNLLTRATNTAGE